MSKFTNEGRIGALEAQITQLRRHPSPEARAEIANTYNRCDSVFQKYGGRVPEPAPGEGANAYRSRVLTALQRHLPDDSTFKAIRFDSLDPVASRGIMDMMLDSVGAKAAADAANGGSLRAVTRGVEGGQQRTDFYGDSAASAEWLDQFAHGVVYRVDKINRPQCVDGEPVSPVRWQP